MKQGQWVNLHDDPKLAVDEVGCEPRTTLDTSSRGRIGSESLLGKCLLGSPLGIMTLATKGQLRVKWERLCQASAELIVGPESLLFGRLWVKQDLYAYRSGVLLPGIQGPSQAICGLGGFIFDPEIQSSKASDAA